MSMTVDEYRSAISEHDLQSELVEHLEKVPNIYVFAIPNAGFRTLRMGARMKREGMRAGMADLGVMMPAGRIGWLELKKPKAGRQSIQQKAFQQRCLRLGHPYAIARSFDEAKAILRLWGALK